MALASWYLGSVLAFLSGHFAVSSQFRLLPTFGINCNDHLSLIQYLSNLCPFFDSDTNFNVTVVAKIKYLETTFELLFCYTVITLLSTA